MCAVAIAVDMQGMTARRNAMLTAATTQPFTLVSTDAMKTDGGDALAHDERRGVRCRGSRPVGFGKAAPVPHHEVLGAALLDALRPLIRDVVSEQLTELRPSTPIGEWMTVREAAQGLLLSERHVRRLISIGSLTALKATTGGSARVRVSRASVAAYSKRGA